MLVSKEIKFIDIHGHVNFPEYDADREEAIKRANDAGVAMICVGTDVESSKSALELAKNHENMWVTVGIHPTEQAGDKTFSGLEELAKHSKVVAIGECGLDYFHSKQEDIPKQKSLFIEQINLANQVNKPLMLHVRSGKNGKNAYQEAIEILKTTAKVRANFHFFAGTIEDLKDVLDLNCTVSFTGVLTFTRDYDELVKYAPIDRLMSETDCPFVAPAPFRGKRNEPAYVVEVVKAIARIRGEDEEKVADQLLLNAKLFFGLHD